MTTLSKMGNFEEWKKDPLTPSILVQRMAEGETLKEMCKSLELPYSQVARHIAGTPALKMEYDAALQIWADSLAQATVAIAEGAPRQAVDPGGAPLFDEAGKPVMVAAEVPRDKLRVETNLKLAGKWDRERYGEREGPRVAVQINLGDVTREIRELESRLGIGVTRAEMLPTEIPSEQLEEGII